MRKIAGVDLKTPFRLVFTQPPNHKENHPPDAATPNEEKDF